MKKLQTTNYQLPTNQKGFTLIEAIVATSVFAFVISSILGVYVSTIQLDRKSRAGRAVAQNARFIMEFLAKEVRNGTINYPSYPGGTVSGTSDLYLENQANAIEHFYLSGTNLVMNKNGANTNMNSSGVKVTNLKYYIQPVGDPYTVAKTYNEQPRVTVVMELTSNYSTRANDLVKMDLQDTFAVRNYPSRLAAGTGTSPTLTVTIFSTPASINPGDSSTLTWSSTGATSCSASGNWSGSQPLNGNQIVSPAVTSTYTLICTGTTGSVQQSTTVTVVGTSPDTTAPVVTAFDVNPKTTSGSVTATFTATDSGGSHLNNAELWRAVYNSSNCTTTVVTGCSWSTVNTAVDPTTNDDGPWSGSITDTPPGGFSYIYGIHVYDNAGNFGVEPARIKVDTTASYAGTGADGPITVSGTYNCQTQHLIEDRENPDCAAVSVTQNANAGDPSIKISDRTPFAAGDEVLIIQMTGTGAGNYEFQTITTVQNNNFIVFSSNLTNAYNTSAAQVIRVPNYTTVTVNNGGTFTVSAWNGSLGGVLPFRASVSLTVNSGGTIDVSGEGFRGGPTASGVGVNGKQGEGYCGTGSVSTAQNCGGGGGGTQSFSGGWYGAIGGGGGYATAGDNGLRDSRDTGGASTPGVGGIAYGVANLVSQIFPGAGGGASGNYSSGVTNSTAPGGAGGGIIYTAAASITVNGTIKSNGANGTWVGNSLGGAGGAGGSIYLKGGTISLGANLVQAAKGTSFSGTLFGSVGRISVYYQTSITGTTLPAATVTLFPPDTIAPVVSAFDVQPRSTSGSVTATFTATDTGGSHLKNAELWRAVYNSSNCTTTVVTGCSWSTVNTTTAPAGLDSWSGTVLDSPAAGSYIYGVHVNDNAGNFGIEPARVKVDSTAVSFATGGTITTSGGYTIHTFTSSGTFTVNGSGTVQVLVVAGGGSGASGGGGAGGMLENNSYSVTPGNITVTVGAGGTVNNNNAGNSVFGTMTATAGGRGQDTSGAGFNGGSGGGANATQNNHGTGIAGQGNNGGDAAGANGGGGGGGGGSAGSNGSGSSGGNGGGGRVSSISGSSVTYAGGGGGAGLSAGGGGGAGGGGNGGVNSSTAGATNRGGGGGGGWYVAGASGGSGIVIIRYLTPDTIAPVVSAFDVQPRSTSGSVTATFTATDTGGSHLKNAELWRAVYNSSTCTTTIVTGCSWSTVNTITDPTTNDNGPWSGSLADTPPGGSSYIYGIHVNDNANNFGLEPARIQVDVGGFLVDTGKTLNNNLAAYWKLNEASGTRADSIGTNNLTDHNGVAQVAGKQNNAAGFTSASSQYLSVASSSALQTGDVDWTIASWVYLNSKSANGCIVCKDTSTGEYDLWYYAGGDRFRLFVYGAGGAGVNADALGSPSTGQWYFVVAWQDSVANTINIQVNNGAINSTAYAGPMPLTNAEVQLGNGVGGGAFLNGRLDEAGFWKRKLTAQERTDLYNNANGDTYNPFSTDTIAPVVTAFDVQPRSTSGSVTATFTATDTGGSHLKNAELWRAVYNSSTCTTTIVTGCSWSTVNTITDPTTNDNGPWSGSLADTPPGGSSYIYGIHVNDNANNFGLEPARIQVTAVSGFSVDTNGTLNTSLISYWKLDEASGNRADSKSTNTLSELNGSVGSASGKLSNAASFANAAPKLNIADNSALSTGNISFSVAGWFYFNDLASVKPLIMKWEGGTPANREYALILNSGVFQFWLNNASNSFDFVQSPVAVSAGTWYFVTAWYDSSAQTMNIQVNNGTVTPKSWSGGSKDSTATFDIGGYSDGTGYYDNGRIDEIGFWKKVLSAQERTDLYNNANGDTYNPIVVPTITWTGPGCPPTCSQNMSATPTLPFTTPGTYTITVNTAMTMTFKGSAGGGASGGTVHNAGSGGGGGGAVTTGTSVPLVTGKTYTLIVGGHGVGTAGDSTGGSGGATTFRNTTDNQTLVSLNGGTGGQAIICGGSGGTLATGSNGVTGGAGGLGGYVGTVGCTNNTWNGTAGGNATNGAGGGGGGAYNPTGSTGGVGGTGSVAGHAASGRTGGQGGGSSFSGVTGEFGGGGGGTSGVASGSTTGNNGQDGAGVFVFVSAP